MSTIDDYAGSIQGAAAEARRKHARRVFAESLLEQRDDVWDGPSDWFRLKNNLIRRGQTVWVRALEHNVTRELWEQRLSAV